MSISRLQPGAYLSPVTQSGIFHRAHLIADEFTTWKWRSVANFRDRIQHIISGAEPNYSRFHPNGMSMGRFADFVWLERPQHGRSLILHVGDIRDCNFSMFNPHGEVFLPKGWTRDVIHLIRNGVTSCSETGRVVLSNGENGQMQPSFFTEHFCLNE